MKNHARLAPSSPVRGSRSLPRALSTSIASLLAGSLLTIAGGLLTGTSASAADGTWTQTTSGGLWGTTTNWLGGIVADGSGFTANFNTLDITADNTVRLDASHTLTNLIFGDTNTGTAASWILDNNGSSANILTLAAGTTPTITVNALGTGKSVTISGVVASSGAWTKAGVGTLILTNAANTITGATTVSDGTLMIGGAGLINTSTYSGAITLTAATSVFDYAASTSPSYTGIISGLGSLRKTGSGSLSLAGNSTYTGGTTITAGTLNLNFPLASAPTNILASTGALTLNGGTLLLTGNASTTNSQAFSGTTLAGGAAITLTANATANPLSLNLGTLTRNTGGTVNITQPTGTVSAANGVVFTAGTGVTAKAASTILTATNGAAFATVGGTDWAAMDPTNSFVVGLSTVSGYTAFATASTVTLTGNADLTSAAAGTYTIGAASTTKTIRNTTITGNTLALGGFVVKTGGLLSSLNLTISGTGSLQAANAGGELVLNQSVNTTTISSIIANNTSASSVTKTGAGAVSLGGVNTYTGGTTISGGNLIITNAGALGTGTLTVGAGATGLASEPGSGTTGNFLYLSGLTGSQVVANNIVLPADTATTYRKITVVGSGSTVYGSNNYNFAGVISGGGVGTLLYFDDTISEPYSVVRLSNSNTFTGRIEFNRASLQIDSDTALGASSNALNMDALSTSRLIFNYTGNYTHPTTLSTATNFDTGANTITASGVISGGAGLTKIGAGTLNLTATNTSTSTTTLAGGTLNLDYSTNNTTKLADAASLTLAGGTLGLIGGSHTEIVASTTLNAGATTISQTGGGTSTISLGSSTITRGAGSTLELGAGGIATSVSGTGLFTTGLGVLGVVGGNDWIARNGTTSLVGYSTLASNYTPTTATTISGNADVAAGVSTTTLATGGSATTIRFNQNQATTITNTTGTLSLTQGGILVTSAVGSNTTTISGGTLVSGSNEALFIFQNNTSGGLTIGSVVADRSQTGNTSYNSDALTKSGAGTLTLGGVNTYSGQTYLNGGTTVISADSGIGGANGTFAGLTSTLASTSVSYTGGTLPTGLGIGTSLLGSTITAINDSTKVITLAAGGATTALTGGTASWANAQALNLNGGTLQTTATTSLTESNAGGTTPTTTVDRTVVLGGNGGTFNTDPSTTLTVAGVISGIGGLTKSGTGNLVLSGASSYFGDTIISGGTLSIAAAANLGSSRSITFGGGNLTITGTGQTLAEAINLNSATLLTTPSASGAITFSGKISGSGPLTLTGTGDVTFSDLTSNYSGGTTLNNAVRLGISASGALGTGAVTINGTSTPTSGTGSQVFANNNAILPNNFTISGSGGNSSDAVQRGALRLDSGAIVNGTVTLAADAAIGSNTGTGTVNGVVSGGFAITKVDAGTITLTAANTYSGGTVISAGTVTVGNNNALGTGAVAANSSYGTGSVSGSIGAFLKTSVSGLNIPNAIALSTTTAGYYGLTQTTGTGSSLTVSGVISGGIAGTGATGGTTLQLDSSTSGDGSSNITLSGINTFAGELRLNRGTVTLTNASAAGVANIFLQSNANSNGNLIFTNSFTLANNVAINTSGDNISTTGANNVTLSGIISGTATAWSKVGTGTLTLTNANTSTAAITVSAGTLTLGFGTVSSNILSSSVALTLGSATLNLTGTGTQTLAGLTTTANTSSKIALAANETLTLGALTSAGANSSLNFNTVAGGANASTPALGTGLIVLTGQTAGNAINSGFTVSDAGGFGLATVDASNNVIRQTTTATLLPATGAVVGTDYLVDNNAGGAAAAGSSSLAVTLSEAAKSITVDTTASAGTLTLNSGVILSNNTWNFGGTGTNTYQITGSAGGAGLKPVLSGDAMAFNNYNTGTVTIASPILANGTNAVIFNGAGTTILTGLNTYTGGTTISAGTTLQIGSAGSLNSGSYAGTIANNGVFRYGSSAAQTLSGAISGSGSLIQNGAGTLTLSATNTFTGGTTVNAGILIANGPNSATGALGGGNVTVNSGGTIQVGGDNSFMGTSISATKTITINSGGLITNTGSSSNHLNALVMNGGTLSATTANGTYGNWNFDQGISTLGATSTTSSITGGNAALTQTGGTNINVQGTDNLIISTVLGNFGANSGDTGLVKNGTGTLTLSGANTYTSGTTFNQGTIRVSIASIGTSTAFGTKSVTVTTNTANAATTNTLATASGSAALTLANNIAITNNGIGTSTLALDGGFANLTLSGIISGNGNLSTVSTGKVFVTGNNTYTGSTVLTGFNTLVLSGANATSGITVGSGTTLALRTISLSSSQNITGAGNVTKDVSTYGSSSIAGTNNNYTGSTIVNLSDFKLAAGGVINGTSKIDVLGQFLATFTNQGSVTTPGAVTLFGGSYNGLGGGVDGLFTNGDAAGTTPGVLNAASITLNTSYLTAAGTAHGGQFVNNPSSTVALGGGAITVNGSGSSFAGGTVGSGSSTFSSAGSVTAGSMVLNSSTTANTVANVGGTYTQSAGTTTFSGAVTLAANGGAGAAGSAGNDASLSVSGGTFTAGSLAVNGGTVSLTGGTLKLGVGGLTSTGASPTKINLGAGTVGATAGWSSSVGATLTDSITGTSVDTTGGDIGLSGVLTGSGQLNKVGSGKLTLAGANNYTGPTSVSSGTLEVSGSISGSTAVNVAGGTLLLSGTGDRLSNATTSAVTLSGGTLAFASTVGGGLSETAGALTLSNNSTLDFGTGTTGNTLTFAPGATFAGGTLAIWNWSPGAYGSGNDLGTLGDAQDRLLFSGTGAGLTDPQLAQISFYSGPGTGFLGNGAQVSFGSSFEIVPVPEPSSTALLGSLALLGLVGFRERRRWLKS